MTPDVFLQRSYLWNTPVVFSCLAGRTWWWTSAWPQHAATCPHYVSGLMFLFRGIRQHGSFLKRLTALALHKSDIFCACVFGSKRVCLCMLKHCVTNRLDSWGASSHLVEVWPCLTRGIWTSTSTAWWRGNETKQHIFPLLFWAFVAFGSFPEIFCIVCQDNRLQGMFVGRLFGKTSSSLWNPFVPTCC